MLQQFAGTGQGRDPRRPLAIEVGVELVQPLDPRLRQVDPGLARQHPREQAAAHADAAMDAPDRDRNILGRERIAPGEHMVVDAVDERAVEVEENRDPLLVGVHGALISSAAFESRSRGGFRTMRQPETRRSPLSHKTASPPG